MSKYTDTVPVLHVHYDRNVGIGEVVAFARKRARYLIVWIL